MLNYASLSSGFTKITVGSLAKEVIDVLGLQRAPCDILLWNDRFDHIQKHLPDFQSQHSFEKCVSSIPEIIASPDYVGLHPTKGSIEYIKRVDELTIVAVRLKPHGNLAVRTVFPLTEAQLRDYLQKGTIKPLGGNP